jgi:hypothetical protein
LRRPTQLTAGLRGVTEQGVDLGRPKIARIHADHGAAGRGIDGVLVEPGAGSTPHLCNVKIHSPLALKI